MVLTLVWSCTDSSPSPDTQTQSTRPPSRGGTTRPTVDDTEVSADDMYVKEEVPIVDDPANTTAVYRKEDPLSRHLDEESRSLLS